MTLQLDPRQRAMLREMGVRVWLPAEPVTAIESRAARAADARTAANFHDAKPALKAIARTPIEPPPPRAPAAPVRSAPVSAPGAVAAAAGQPTAWRLGDARSLYSEVEAQAAPGARWLVLAETAPAALAADPLQGEAGKLLGNMLRAARMRRSGAVLLAPLLRHAGANTDFSAALAALVAREQPDLVLVMGRLAAQAVLPGDQPFGKLRGQVHRLHGANTIVTYDAPYLLRNPADKAKAWDDLCLAMSLAG